MSRALKSPIALRATRSLLVAALALAGLTCRDNSVMGPGLPARASFAVVPHFETVPGGPVVQLSTARVQVFRMPVAVADEAILDTTAAFVGNDALTLDLTVTILGASSDFLYRITAMDAAGNVIYAATDSVTVVVGVTPDVPENVTLQWATADTLVRSLRVFPRDTVITANEPFTFGVIAKKADSSVVVASVGWVSRDESKLHIDQGTGSATALTQFSNVWIVATMGTGLQDSTLVSATQPVTSVVVNPPSATVFVGATQQLTAQVSAAGGVPLPTRPISWTTSNAAVATVTSGGFVTAVAVGNATITATSGGISATSAITVSKKTPLIVWATPADINYGTALSATQLNANAVFNSASVPGTFVYTPAAGTVLAAGSAQALSVTFTPADPSTFGGANGGTTINVLKANQTITFAAIPDHFFGEADFTVTATASSGLAVTFAASGACTITGATVKLTASGSCTITASQAGDANRNAAADVSRTFNVGKASLAIVAASASGVFGGNASLSATVTTGGSPLAGKLVNFSINGVAQGAVLTDASGVASLTASLAGINAGTYVGAVSPAAGILASFAGDANFNASQAVGTLVVTKATATLALGTLAFPYDGTPKPVSVTTTPAGLTGVSVTYNGLATAPTDAGSYAVVASLTHQNYQAANATGTLIIGQASQTITFGPLSSRVLGEPAFTVSATTNAGLPVTFEASGSCTVAGDQVSLVAEGTCTITASQAGNVNFLAATAVSQSFNISPRPVATVEINPTSTVVEVNQTVLFTVIVRAANNEILNGRQVDWSTGNTAIATVDNGIATGKSVGQTTVTATVEGVSAVATLDVQPPPITVDSTRLVSLDGDTLYSIGAKRLLDARAYYANNQVPGQFTWRSVDTEIVTVDNFGLATAISNGTTQVIVTEDGGTADTLEIAVLQKLARIAITPNYVKLVPGATATLSASGYDALDNEMPVSEQISWYKYQYYDGVVEIDEVSGEVTAVEPGNATIVAESGELEARALVEVGTLVRSVVVTGGNFDALSQSVGFNAIAYDEGGRPMPGVDVEWESLNESVVRPTSFDGSTMVATSYINGTTLIRATIQGVRGELPVTVQQRLGLLMVTPSAVSLDIGGVAILTAQAYDVNERPMTIDPGEISWQSQNASVVRVDDRTGVVTGLERSGSPVAVTAIYGQGALIQGSASVTVEAPLSALSFGVPLITVGKGQTIPVTLYLNHPSSQQMTVDLAVSGSNAVWKTSSVDVLATKSTVTAEITGVTAGTVTISATSREGGWTAATATLAVQPIASIPYVDDDEMNTGEEKVSKVYLNDPAPAGGSWVSFSYSTPGVAAVFPDRAFIPAGQIAADIMVRGIGGGTTTIRPVMPGVMGVETEEITVYPAQISVRLPEITRVIGAGQYEFGIVGGYDGGGDKALKSRALRNRAATLAANKSGALPKGAPARVATGIGQWADGFDSYSCSDYGEGGEGGYLNLEDGGGQEYEIPGDQVNFVDYCLRVGTDPEPALLAQLQSSNSSVLLVESEVEIEDEYQGFAVAGVRPGQATVTASAAGWGTALVSVVVSTPRLSVLGGYSEELDDSVTLAEQRGYYGYIEVGDSLANPHPLINSLRVRLSSSDPSVFTVDDSVAVIDDGESYTYSYFSLSPVNPGRAWIRFTSDGYLSDSVMVIVPAQGLAAERVVYVGAGKYSGFDLRTARPSQDMIPITVTSLTDTTLAGIDPEFTLEGGYGYTVYYRGYAPGSTDFVFTSPGFAPETVTVVVTTAGLLFDSDATAVTLGSTVGRAVYAIDSLGSTNLPNEPFTVTFESKNTSIATVVSELEMTSYYVSGIDIVGVSEGTTQIIATAPGHAPDTLTVTVARRKLSFMQEPGQVAVGGKQYVYYYGNYEPYVQTPDYVVDSLVLKVRPLTPGRTTVTQPRMVLYAGGYVSNRFSVVGEAAGFDSIVVEDSAGIYAPDTMVVEVLPSYFGIGGNDTTVISTSDQSGMPTYAYLFDRVNHSNHQVGKPINVNVTSTDPTVIQINSPVVAVGSGTEVIYFSFSVLAVGETDIILSDAAGQVGSDTVHVIVKGKRLYSNYTNVSVGMRQRIESTANVVHEGTYEGDLVVTLTSSDPSIASVPATVVLPYYPGGSATFPIDGGDTIGTVRIKMEADGFEPGYLDVEVGRPRIAVNVYDQNSANSSVQMSVYATDQYGNQRTPLEDVVVTLISSDPTVAAADSTTFTIDDGSCQGEESCSDDPVMYYKKAGRTVFTVRDSRYPGQLHGYRPYVDTIHVTKAQLSLQSPYYYYYSPYVGAAQVDSVLLLTGNSVAEDVTVSLRSSNPSIITVPATVTVSAGSSQVYVPIYGKSLNDGAEITATAPGYFSGATYAYTRQGIVDAIVVSGTMTIGEPTVMKVRTWDPSEQPFRSLSAVTSKQTFTLDPYESSLDIYEMDGVTPLRSISVDSGAYESASFIVVPRQAEYNTFLINGNPNFADGSYGTMANYPSSATVNVLSSAPYVFTPPDVHIAQGGSVTWDNQTGLLHNLTFALISGAPASTTNSANWTSGTQVKSFTSPGLYSYQCSNHAQMVGTVQVH